MKAYREVDVLVRMFFTFVVAGSEWSTSHPDSFIPGGWMGPRTCLEDTCRRKSLCPRGLDFQSLSRPTLSHLLHQLRYPDGSNNILFPQPNGRTEKFIMRENKSVAEHYISFFNDSAQH
jgi:hypothetical protein